ncbi:MAG: hypothetical protein LBR53_09580 [Deltaproteobacteria bacterium]|nr:hypothetical protein [Deltaproteobacteria bacterium]
MEDFEISIDFARRPLARESRGKRSADARCVIIGFSASGGPSTKIVCEEDEGVSARNINPCLPNAPNVFVSGRTSPSRGAPPMGVGNKPPDGGNYLFTFEEEREFLLREPGAEKFLRPFVGAREFFTGRPRRCLFLGGADFDEPRELPEILKRVVAARLFRLGSRRPATGRFAEKPLKFHAENAPESPYPALLRVTGSSRERAPMGFLAANVVAGDSMLVVSGAALFHFAVLASLLHMTWMRAFRGRLKSGYRYSKRGGLRQFPPAELRKVGKRGDGGLGAEDS